MKRRAHLWIVALAAATLLGTPALSEPLRAVATTTIVGDIVREVAGDLISLYVLLSANADPHAFQPTPRDVVSIHEADVVFISGAGLEAPWADILESAASRIVDLSERLALRQIGEEHHHDHDEDHDPHVWFDPTNVMVWADTIEAALSELDPGNALAYAASAAAYRQSLAELDLWIWDEIAAIARDRRLLVSDHLSLGYFAARYGFEQIGSLFPGLDTLSEPSAQGIAQLVDAIRDAAVPAILVGTTVNPSLAEAIAADAGTAVVTLYTGSLSESTGPAATYLALMRYNVEALVRALSR
jgi:ABC-type Zn uptake system ZnuABC Zn-binding protein ZnuA